MVTVLEDEDKGLLFINGHKYDGHIDDETCERCLELRLYADAYDAYFCAHCNEWIDDACSDRHCQYCAKRPWKPLEATIV